MSRVGRLTSYGVSGRFYGVAKPTVGAIVEATAVAGVGIPLAAGVGAISVDIAVTGTATPLATGVGSIDSVAELLGTGDFTGTPTVVQAGGSGGWNFLFHYDHELRRRRHEAEKRKALEEETESIQNELDRNIAELLREQEALDAKRKDLERLGQLAKERADVEAARQYSERVAKAYERAIEKQTFSALEALDRELQRASEEEEFLLLALSQML